MPHRLIPLDETSGEEREGVALNYPERYDVGAT
jgi:hypothetical protein